MNVQTKKIIELCLPVILLGYPLLILVSGIVRVFQGDNLHPDAAVALGSLGLLVVCVPATVIYGWGWLRQRRAYQPYRRVLGGLYLGIGIVALIMTALAVNPPEWLLRLVEWG